ncbi:DUF927 domain-containing protein [Lachnoclostridium sp. Marseille-P6806]|uniref:DUF927 domain-containing protein n=1 Tax=Lachnoclostridium sp. Marseille-P6806 TaxID=2364793 RepID=UPI003567ECF6
MSTSLKEFTKEEFNTEAPYRLLFEKKDDGFAYLQLYNDLNANAERVGFKRFGAMAKAYMKQHEEHRSGLSSVVNNLTNFKDQPIELLTGDWFANDDGILRRNDNQGMDVACVHPILPVQRLVNIDDGTVRLRIMFRRDFRGWREVIANKSTLFSSREIKKLADKDISVSDKNAAFLVEYLQDLEDLNHNIIPEAQSVSHLGWTSNGMFSPYMENLEFDGQENFRKIFESVHSCGEFEKWLEITKSVRKTDSAARIALAASFASIIIKTIGKLNFMLHFWGGSGTGKTVAQLLAVSVWGDPNDGAGYLQTFNGTLVGLEQLAGFVNNLPLILDEFQLVKDKKSFEQTVYMLCEGIGKTRGAKTGGLQKTPTWKNCTITSGESPITHASSGAGAINRIIEIECREALFEDAIEVLEVIRSNYGHAGKLFMAFMSTEQAKEKAAALYKQFYRSIGASSTEKQTMAAAILLTADALATEWIFCDGRALTAEDIEPYLHTKEAVDVGARGYEYVHDFYVSNAAKFETNSDPCFGSVSGDEVRIIKSVFERICDDGGYSPRALLSWLDQSGRLSKGRDNLYKSAKVNGKAVRCACINMAENSPNEFVSVEDGELPFN